MRNTLVLCGGPCHFENMSTPDPLGPPVLHWNYQVNQRDFASEGPFPEVQMAIARYERTDLYHDSFGEIRYTLYRYMDGPYDGTNR